MSTRPRLLLGSVDVPHWGGAASVHYALFDLMRRDGHAVHYVNLPLGGEAPMLQTRFGRGWENPRDLPDVATLILADPLWRLHENLAAHIAALRPDLLVARGYIAAWVMRRAAPELPLVFLVTGSHRLKQLLYDGLVDDYLDFERLARRGVEFPEPARDREREAIEGSDLIVLHSPHVRRVYQHFVPGHLGTVYARDISDADGVYAAAQPFAHLARPFAERDIDVLLVASDWRRPEKNYPLAARLARACPELRFHLVGAAPDDDAPLARHGLIGDAAALFALYGRARAVVSPSRFDAAPGVLFEASAMGGNVVATPNCGNWQLCHEELVAPTAAQLPDRLRRAVTAPLPDRRARFLGGYAELVEVLHDFA